MVSPYDQPPQGSFPSYYGAAAGAYPAPPSPQSIIDDEHLRLLRIGYFISAGQTAIFIPLGLFYAGMGFMVSHLPLKSGGGAPPELMSWVFGIVGASIAGLAALAAILKLLTGIRLKQRRSRMLCMVTAAFSCLEIPYGTALGLMTLVVLGRPSVRQLFEPPR